MTASVGARSDVVLHDADRFLSPVRVGGVALEEPAPALVAPGSPDRSLPWRRPTSSRRRREPSPASGAACWLLGAHGGSGVSSLVRCGVAGVDAERAWPPAGHAVVVVRRTAYGLEWARDAARQHASGGAPEDVRLAGLVVVADAPGRSPARVQRFLELVAGAYARVWEIPWVEEWRLAGHAEPLPMPPAARHLDQDLRALAGARVDSSEQEAGVG